jgi:hypothetical protein
MSDLARVEIERDIVEDGGEFQIDREPNEDEESYCGRLALYSSLFGRGN